MTDVSDMDLIREYAARGAEASFAAIVERHINFVYSVALRFVGNSQDAQDVAQAVFIILAKKAESLRHRTNLTGWLYETTRFTAMRFLRGKTSRESREQEAYMQSTSDDANPNDIWWQLAPLLEEAMTRLGEKDRALVALRFFENKSLAETASLMAISEWAAHKRSSRALEKLRQFFARRGVVSTATGIAGAMSANSIQIAPQLLAQTVTAAAIGKGAVASVSTLTLIKGTFQLMAWSKTKTAIIVGVGVLLASGITAALIYHRAIAHRFELASAKRAVKQQIATPVDLVDFYTAPASAFHTFTRFPAWGRVPVGFQVFDHVPLNIGGSMTLWGGGFAKATHGDIPEQMLGLGVQRKFETLYIYQGAFYDAKPGTPVYSVVFNYSDGSSATNYVRAGDDVLDWVATSSKNVRGPTGPNSKLAWVGGGLFSTKRPYPVRFTLTAINNPNPDLEVSTMDLHSCKSYSAPVILAMTVGKAGLMKQD